MKNILNKMPADEFVRRLKTITSEIDKRFVIFIGAGCSVSSGIPTASNLVKNTWLPRLRDVCAPEQKDIEKWAKEKFPKYNPSKPYEIYGEAMETLLISPEERQREVENLCEGKFPGFGYAVLSNLVATQSDTFNVVLTTNFDDLMSDALYLFSSARPLVIHHESLAGFIRPTRTRPLIVKLHGDQRLAPHNTPTETAKLQKDIEKKVSLLLHDRGLIFIGYGGNDQSIKNMLENTPEEGIPLGVYWVGSKQPNCILCPWLESRKAIWVDKGDFDELMLLFRDIFDIPHPEQSRFDDLFEKYKATYDKLSARVVSLPNTAPGASAMKKAVRNTDDSFPDWWSVMVKAKRLERTKPKEANDIYVAGLQKFPSSALLHTYYAHFLTLELRQYDKADECYRKAIKLEPRNSSILGDYATFLSITDRDMDKAEEYFNKSIELNPKSGSVICNYAIFLEKRRKDPDKAEEYFNKAIEVGPPAGSSFGAYADFLVEARKEYDRAEKFFKQAIAIEPQNHIALGNYATFLKDIRKEYNKAEEFFRRAFETDGDEPINLVNYAGFLLGSGKRDYGLSLLDRAFSCKPPIENNNEWIVESWFYAFAHRPEEARHDALKNLKKSILSGFRSPGWNFSMNIDQAKKDGHPDIRWLEKLSDVITKGADIKILEEWDDWKKA